MRTITSPQAFEVTKADKNVLVNLTASIASIGSEGVRTPKRTKSAASHGRNTKNQTLALSTSQSVTKGSTVAYTNATKNTLS